MKTIRLLVLLIATIFLLQGCHWFHHRHGHPRHGYSYGYSYDDSRRYNHRYERRHYPAYRGSIYLRIPHVDVIIR
jgi:hypothetical protein